MSKKYLIISLIIFILTTGILYFWLSLGKVDTLLEKKIIIQTNKEPKSTTSGEIGLNILYNSFVVEGENVYWTNRNFPNEKNIIDGADAKTFELLNECKHELCYAKDKSRVYLLSESMRNVGFSILGEAIPNTFRILTGSYSRDENNIFCKWNKIPGIDIAIFRTLGQRYATDNRSVYWECHKLDGIDDPKSLTLEVNGEEVTLQDQNFIYEITGIGPEETQVEKFAKNISFSSSQITEILKKIDENTKKQQEIKKNATGVLIQGEYRAKYISNNFDVSKADSIIITKNGIQKSIPGIHPYPTATRIDPEFDFISKLVEFSPTGNYLLYDGVCDMSCPSGLLDTQNGKEILTFNNLGFHAWTEDRKQFIFGQSYGGPCKGGSLSITIYDDFPKTKTILELNYINAFMENKMLYVRSYDMKKICDPSEKEFLRVYSLINLREVFSQEIK